MTKTELRMEGREGTGEEMSGMQTMSGVVSRTRRRKAEERATRAQWKQKQKGVLGHKVGNNDSALRRVATMGGIDKTRGSFFSFRCFVVWVSSRLLCFPRLQMGKGLRRSKRGTGKPKQLRKLLAVKRCLLGNVSFHNSLNIASASDARRNAAGVVASDMW